MSTSLAPLVPGRVSRWRALLRIARRDARRHLGRSVLVAVLVGLPVLLLSALSVVVRSAIPEPSELAAQKLAVGSQARLEALTPGTALVQSVDAQDYANVDQGDTAPKPEAGPAYQGGTDPRLVARMRSLLPSRDRLVTQVSDFPQPGRLRFGDRAIQALLQEVSDLGALQGVLDVVSGRAPQARTEVLVSAWLARTEGIGVGDTLTLRSGPGPSWSTYRVVGLVDAPDIVAASDVVGLPGALLPPSGSHDNVTWQVLGPDPVNWDVVLGLNQLGVTVLSRQVVASPPPQDRVPFERQPDSGAIQLLAVLSFGVAIGLVLLQVVLLAGPAVAVGARRNQHTLALLAAAGADRRHLRGVVLGSAGVAGLVGCTAAATAGAGLGRLGLAALERGTGSSFPGVHVHLLDLTALVAVGALTALAAAVLPARQAARLDVIAALTGRRASPPPRAAVPLAGLLLAVAGGIVAVVASERRWGIAVLAGVAAGAVGLLLMSGGIVALAARAAHLLPPAPRLALRDAVRNRGRTAPAVAAVMAAIAGGVAVTLYTTATDEQSRRGYTPSAVSGTASVTLTDPIELGTGRVSGRRQVQLDATVRDVAAAVRKAVAVASVVPMRWLDSDVHVSALPTPAAACPIPPGDSMTPQEQAVQHTDPRCRPRQLPGEVGTDERLLVDDGTATAVLTGSDAARSALAAGRVVVFDDRLLWPDGRVHLSIARGDGQSTQSGQGSPGGAFPATVVHLEHPYITPVLPPSVAARAKLPVAVEKVLLATPQTSQSGEERAVAAVADTGLGELQFEHGYQDAIAPGLIALAVAMVIIAFVGTVTAVGLALAEGRTEAIAYAAVGASPGLRRRLAAAQAAVISVLGGLSGVAGGLLVGYVLGNMTTPSDFAADPHVGLGTELATAWPYLVVLALGPVLTALAASFVFTRTNLPLVE